MDQTTIQTLLSKIYIFFRCILPSNGKLYGSGSFLLLEQHWQYIWGNKNKLLLQEEALALALALYLYLYLLLLWVLPQCLPLTLH